MKSESCILECAATVKDVTHTCDDFEVARKESGVCLLNVGAHEDIGKEDGMISSVCSNAMSQMKL